MSTPPHDDLATLRSQLKRLQQARYNGARRVRFRSGEGEREIEYRTDGEIAAAINDLQASIGRLEGTTTATTIVVRSSKGW